MSASPFHIVFFEPEIPQNTGSTARLCAATGATLHLVGKLGFRTDAAAVKRAGLDYWPHVTVIKHASWDAFLEHAGPDARLWFFSKSAERIYSTADFAPGDYLVFGPETRGLPPEILSSNPDHCVGMPIRTDKVRSLNLATAAGIALYEALRQTNFLGI
jgi:tRNA (cytidine/uridine-2'-O-)-methyltransferase